MMLSSYKLYMLATAFMQHVQYIEKIYGIMKISAYRIAL